MSSFFSWFSTSTPGKLILQADKHTSIPGFQTDRPLVLSASRPNETIGDLLEKLNKYRGPDNQITSVWRLDGTKYDASAKVVGEMTGIVKAT